MRCESTAEGDAMDIFGKTRAISGIQSLFGLNRPSFYSPPTATPTTGGVDNTYDGETGPAISIKMSIGQLILKCDDQRSGRMLIQHNSKFNYLKS